MPRRSFDEIVTSRIDLTPFRRPSAVWAAFLAVHVWIGFVGVAWIPKAAFWDLDLYRYWVWLGVHTGQWPALDVAWVYPAGGLLPMILAGIGGLGYGSGFALVWCLMVTALDAAAFAVLLRRRHGIVAGWWWTAFLLLLGPIAVGRLDAMVAPLVVVGLLWGLDRPAVASFLLTAGAWIKVAPGALVASLFLVARRPWRDAVVPAVATSAVVVGTVVGLGGREHVASFLLEQGARGLQIEAVGATPWVLGALFTSRIERWFSDDIGSWEIRGLGTAQMADLLGALFAIGLIAAVGLLWWRRQRLGRRLWTDRVARSEVLIRGALLLTLAMLVFNKVGSPQYMSWLTGPVVAALAIGLPGWRRTAGLVLAVGAATQIVFPWWYWEITHGGAGTTLILAGRNVALVVLLVWTVKALLPSGHDEATGRVGAAAGTTEALPDEVALAGVALGERSVLGQGSLGQGSLGQGALGAGPLGGGSLADEVALLDEVGGAPARD